MFNHFIIAIIGKTGIVLVGYTIMTEKAKAPVDQKMTACHAVVAAN